MKVLESTKERLVIGREEYTSAFELVWLALWINALITTCFVVISENLPSLRHSPFGISFIIGWLLSHFLFPENKKEKASTYWFVVAFGSIPFLGVSLLPFVAICIFVAELQFPNRISLIFDKDKNLLTIKSKFLLWYPTVRYALDEILGTIVVTNNYYVGSMTMRPVEVVQMTRRRRDGKILQKNILYGADANHGMTHRINRFLMHRDGNNYGNVDS